LLLIVLGAGFSSVFLLPRHFELPEAGVRLELPEYINGWYGRDLDVSQRERDVLGPETQFARKRYMDAFGGAIDVSVVLSGEDMNTSIHRPERCLPAQGFTVVESHRKTIELGSGPLSVTRLHNVRKLEAYAGNASVTGHHLSYYWFIGSTETTPSHTSREMIDIRDRVLKGTVQRWAYITVTSTVTKGLERFGKSEAEVDRMLEQFVQDLVPLIEKPSVANR
jgi:EpsI family protein